METGGLGLAMMSDKPEQSQYFISRSKKTLLPQEKFNRGLRTGDRLWTEPEQQQLVDGAGLADQILIEFMISRY